MEMNTTTTDNEILSLARVTCEELDPAHEAWMEAQRERDLADYDAQREPAEDGDDMSEYADDQQGDDDEDEDDDHGFNHEPREDNFRDDVDADANALAGAGYGTDEDYGLCNESWEW